MPSNDPNARLHLLDPALIAHLRAHPAAMSALDDVAGRYGQELDVALSVHATRGNLPRDVVLVRTRSNGAPIAAITPGGTIRYLDGDA